MKDYEPLSGVDAAWLRMDEPTNLMTITSVLVLEDPMDLATLREIVAERFVGFTRFRQRIRPSSSGVQWELDPHFDLTQHVRRSALPGDAGKHELQEHVSELMSMPLDRNKPLWDLELIEDYAGGSAVIARIHHCIADGIALVQVLLSLTDEYFDPSRFPKAKSGSRLPSLIRAPLNAAKKAADAASVLINEGAHSIVDPSRITHRAKQGLSLGAALSKLALIGADSDTRIKGNLGVAQNAAWSGPIDLEVVKETGRAIDAKVNDVLLGAVAGALRHYLEQHGDPTDGISIRGMIPVNLRPIEDAFDLGNRFGLVYVDLPVGLGDRTERVLSVKQQMDEIKASSEAAAAFGILEVLGYFPNELEEQAVRLFSSKASAVLTNVPGPRKILHMKGHRLQHIMPWVPRAGNIGLGISIFSYAGEVRLGIACDNGLIPDPGTILEGFEEEFDQIVESFGENRGDTAPSTTPPENEPADDSEGMT
ncbi:wax ester/triacylglycerol synthase family O-acyltransferase [Longibacter salinarum]|uniref:diacylglycerol O-acyltransferase n=1 Tax=Longibacter salinarum TaxID=1850348 RepID=A0A2A8D0N0_9BACT|nr:wax ester/triacylglycerol synthase family O-acyltransferase [Longibacter salinarum]PEN14208.1 wax ester/triacylglycerol synthase family O-acyltransferase [Longibacter salinarum]